MSVKVGHGIIEPAAFDRDNNLIAAEVPISHSRQVSMEIYLDGITKEWESNFGPGKYFSVFFSLCSCEDSVVTFYFTVIPLTEEEGVYLPYVLNVFTYNVKPAIEVMKVFATHEES